MSNFRILIVEDEWVIAEDLRHRLEQLGHTVVAAVGSGEEAVAAAEREEPELVLMDIMLAGRMDGIEAAGIIRARRDVPLIYLTAYADPAILERAKVTAPSGYLIKPFEDRELAATIEMALYRHTMERRVRESEQFLHDLTAGLGEGLLYIDRRERVGFFNPEASRLLGRVAEEADRGEIMERLGCGVGEECGIRRAWTERTTVRVEESEFLRADGTPLPVAYAASPLLRGGEVRGVVVVFRDISERKRAEAELRRAKEEAEAANRAKSEFLSVMSHELRTPLTAVLGMADLLAGSGLNPQQRSYLEIQQRSGQNLLDLIGDILDFSRAEAGRLQLEPGDFDPRALVAAALAEVAGRAREKRLALESTIDAAVPARLYGDAKRLRQILLNLLGNAIKFTEHGTVRLSVGPTTTGGRGELHLAVADTGIGIAREDQLRIFEPFTQVDSSSTRSHGGTGLGLTISSRLAKLLGGNLWVESSLGRGSTFHLIVRLAVPSPREGEGAAYRSPSQGE